MASSLFRTKGLSSFWCLARPSSAVSGAMGNSMCTLWLMFLSLGSLGVLGDSYCCSSCWTAILFSSVQWLAESVPLCICHVLGEPPKWKLHPALVSQHLWASTIVSRFCNSIEDGSLGGRVSGWSFPQTLFQLLSLYLLLWVISPFLQRTQFYWLYFLCLWLRIILFLLHL